MKFYILIGSDSIDGLWYPEVYATEESAKKSLNAEYRKLRPADGDCDIEYDEDKMTLFWRDADDGRKYWFRVEQVYMSSWAAKKLLREEAAVEREIKKFFNSDKKNKKDD